MLYANLINGLIVPLKGWLSTYCWKVHSQGRDRGGGDLVTPTKVHRVQLLAMLPERHDRGVGDHVTPNEVNTLQLLAHLRKHDDRSVDDLVALIEVHGISTIV